MQTMQPAQVRINRLVAKQTKNKSR